MNSESHGLEELRIDRDEVEETAGRRRSIVFVVLVALLLGLVGFWFFRARPAEVRTETARSVEVSSGARAVLNASGYVVARREATVSSKVTGKVVEVLVEEGMKVEAGQVLARLDASNLTTQLRLAEAQRETARAALAETRVRLTEAEREFRRIRALAESDVASSAELDRATAEVDSLKARLSRQEQEVGVAERQVAVLQQDLEDTIIRAPFSGIAVSKNAQPGEMISPVSAGGGFTRTGIGTIVDMTSLEIEVDVNESYLNRVRTGQDVEATLDAYPDWRIPAKVLAIIPTADRQKATVKVRVKFNQLDPRMLPQMGVRVAFLETETASGQTAGAVIPRLAARKSGTDAYVWVVRDGTVERRPVKVVSPDTEPVHVLTGLTTGERIVVEGPADLEAGRRVREKRR
jgi:RND family efflux transporter MFP subunit